MIKKQFSLYMKHNKTIWGHQKNTVTHILTFSYPDPTVDSLLCVVVDYLIPSGLT